MRTAREKRDAYLARLTQLQADRSSWETHWSDLGRHILPRSPRFSTDDRNRGRPDRYAQIYDNNATRAKRVLSAGLMAGMTSPARPWFKLAPTAPELRDNHAVMLWLDEVVERMQMVFSRSNVYRVLPRMYDELGVFGTAATLVLSDFDSVIRCYPLSVGQYYLQQDWQGRITTCYRTFERSVSEVVKEFGYDNCSTHVRQAFDNRQLDLPIKILHVIEPRADQERNANSPLATDMPWKSVYIEIAGLDDRVLRESGFRMMRVLAPRWRVEGGDVYGISPGMEALGDIKQLQQEQLCKSKAIAYKAEPPLQVPLSVAGRNRDVLPGGVTYFEPRTIFPHDQATPQGGVRTAFDVNLDIGHLLIDIQDVRMRIERAFYVDLFLMLSSRDPQRMTATEVMERQEEKLLMIGPVIERMANELLEPLIDITFREMMEVGALPPPPQELLGADLSVEFVSILAQAQRAVGITSTQQYMNDVLLVAQTRPDVLDNINFDAWVRETARMRGVEADLLVDERMVQHLRDARAQAQAAQEQVAMAREQAGVVKDLSTARVNQDSALDEILRSMNGYAVPGAA